MNTPLFSLLSFTNKYFKEHKYLKSFIYNFNILELFLWKSLVFVSSHNCVQWSYIIIRVFVRFVKLFTSSPFWFLYLSYIMYLWSALSYGWHYILNCDVAILKKTKRLGLIHENISMNSESDTFHLNTNNDTISKNRLFSI